MASYPQAVIQSVDKTKISRRHGFDTTTIHFTFTEPVIAWAVRVNSSNAYDGLLVADQEASRRRGFGRGPFGRIPFGRLDTPALLIGGALGFGRASFGRAPFGRSEPLIALTDGFAEINGEQLLDGINDVTVYAKSRLGWSPRL